MSEGKPIINMGIGSPDMAPSEKVVNALTQSLKDAGAHQYQSYQGIPEFRHAAASFYKKTFNVSINPEDEILPLLGSKEGIMHISLAFLNEGDEVLVPNPGYPTYTSVTKLVGAVPRFYDLKERNKWFPDLKELAGKDLSKVKLMWVNYPHMPTGATASISQLQELVAFAREHSILLVNDNPYSFVLNKEPRSILSVEGAKEIALELNSLSKTFNMAGWRIGMVLGNATLINAILKVKSNMDSGMFYGIQKGAIAALESSQDWYKKLDEVYHRRRNLIFTLATKLQCTFDKNSVGMFVWAKLPDTVVSAENYIDQLLYEKHLFIAPGTIFGSNGAGFIRISLCVTEEKIKEAISRL